MSRVSEIVTPVAVNSNEMVFSNMVYLSGESKFNKAGRFVILKGYVLPYAIGNEIPNGKIGLSKKFRQFLTVSLIDKLHIELYIPKTTDRSATSITFKIEMILPPKERVEVDDTKLVEQFRKNHMNFYVNLGQVFVVNYETTPYLLTVENILGAEDNNVVFISKDTKIQTVPNTEQQLKLKSTKNIKHNVFSDNFKMEELGIGGLDTQLTSIFRRAFASRRLSNALIEKFGIKHVKGILLYGPPGTGKTLIARQLAKTLKAKTIQIVNGPEVFSKYVGESEENIRKLFLKPREDEKKYGDESPLHVIIFDQIDAICRQRGSDTSGTNAKDAVVNQILTNLDGVEALNNIIVIGMTNRKDLIDEAVLRPGRLQVHIQIGLPNQEGRKQILDIHTKRLKQQKLLDNNVNLDTLASLTKNYTGAQLQAVVKNASSFAMTKGNNVMDFSKNLTIKRDSKVTMEDFLKALEEIVPSFGIDQQHFEIFSRGDLINYGKTFQNIMKTLQKAKKLAQFGHSQIMSMMLFGPPGSGKTSIAAHFAKQSNFPYVKLISPDRYIGVSTLGKINSITRIFNDAYKSKESLIVIDNIERLIEFVHVGPDFNNSVLQALLTLIKKIPSNPDSRLLVIGTTSNYQSMDLLDINKVFSLKFKINELNEQQCATVLGAKLGITYAPIKKLCQFKSSIEGKPKSVWGEMWNKFN